MYKFSFINILKFKIEGNFGYKNYIKFMSCMGRRKVSHKHKHSVMALASKPVTRRYSVL
jgi:hypothetical protein